MKVKLIHSTRMRLKQKNKPKTHENGPHGNQKPDIFFVWPNMYKGDRVCVFAMHGHDHDPLRTKLGMVAKGSKAEVTG